MARPHQEVAPSTNRRGRPPKHAAHHKASSTSHDLLRQAYHPRTARLPRSAARAAGRRIIAAIESSDSSDASSDAGGDGAAVSHESALDSDDSLDAGEADGSAPSDGHRTLRRGHRTGLSFSLSHASLAPLTPSILRKRAHSSASDLARPPKHARAYSPSPQATLTQEENDNQDDEDANDDEDDEDDDEVYQAVDLISESEDDGLEEREELAIIASEEQSPNSAILPPQGSLEETLNHSQFDEHFAHIDAQSVREASPSNDSGTDADPPRSIRRVRFADELDASTSLIDFSANVSLQVTSEDELAPEPSNVPNSSVAPTVSGTELLTPGAIAASETDLGDTTDEEILLPTTVHRPEELLHESPIASTQRASRRAAASNRARPRSARAKGPSMGSWVADPNKPMAITDSSGKKLLFYPATCPRSFIPRTSTRPSVPLGAYQSTFSSANVSESEDGGGGVTTDIFDDAVLGPVASHMASTFEQSRESSALLADTSGTFQNINTDDWDETDDDDEAGEGRLRMEDLFNLSDSSADSDCESTTD